MRVKTILNKEVEAEKEGKIVNKQIMEFHNDRKNKEKYQVADLPDFVLEEAGCVKKTRKKEKAVMVHYKAEKVDNYIGDQDVDTILKCIEDPKPIRRMKSPSKHEEQQIADQNIDDDSDSSEVPEDIKNQINKIAVSMIVDHINARNPNDPEPEGYKLRFSAKRCSPPPEHLIEPVEFLNEDENDKRIKCYKKINEDEDSKENDKVPSRDIRTYKDSEMIISFDADGLKDQLVDYWESHPKDQIPDDVKEKIREHKEKQSRYSGESIVSLDEKVPNVQKRNQNTIKTMQPEKRPEKSHMDKTEAEFREYAKQKCLDDVGDNLPENIKETLGKLMDSFTLPTKAPLVSKPNSILETRDSENPLEKSSRVKKCLDDAKARLPENVRESLGHLMDCMAYPNPDEAQQQSNYFGALHKMQETNQRNRKLQEREHESPQEKSSDLKASEAKDAKQKVKLEDVKEKTGQNDEPDCSSQKETNNNNNEGDAKTKEPKIPQASGKPQEVCSNVEASEGEDFFVQMMTDMLQKGKNPSEYFEDIQAGQNDIPVCSSQKETNEKNIEGDVKKAKKSKKPKKPVVRGICDNPSCIVQSAHRCSRCLQVAFCSVQCQAEHWPEHQEDCTPWRQRLRRQQTGAGVD